MQIGPTHYEPSTGVVTHVGGSFTLTPMERQAMAYLIERAGTLVLREQIEREVWGYSPKSRSQAVAVAMRRLRSKIEPDPDTPVVLQTVRGRGWRLVGERPAQSPRLRSPPEPSTPFFPRPDESDGISRLWNDGWRVVTLLGPAGIGKSRLALDFASRNGSWAFVDLTTASSGADLIREVAVAIGDTHASPDAIAERLRAEELGLLLDGADDVLEALSAWLDTTSVRALVTARAPLDRRDEAIHAVGSLDGDVGRAFARAHLRASRWRHDPTDDQLDALIAVVDGSPLAIGLACSQVQSPAEITTLLKEGASRPAWWTQLHAAATGAVESLEPAELQALTAIASFDGPVNTGLLRRYQPQADLTPLATAHLVQRAPAGWTVPQTVRRVLPRVEDSPVEQCLRDPDALFAEPERIAEFAPLLGTWLKRASDDPQALWLAYLTSHLAGPLLPYYDRISRLRAGYPLLSLLQAVARGVPLSSHRLWADADPLTRRRAAFAARMEWRPSVPQTVPELAGDDSLLARLVSLSEPDGDDARSLLRDAASRPLLTWMTLDSIARLWFQQGRPVEALRTWDGLAETTYGAVTLFSIRAEHGRCDALMLTDRGAATCALKQLAKRCIDGGFGDTWAVGRIGMWLCLLGETEAALPLLQRGSRESRRAPALAARILIAALGGRRVQEETALLEARIHHTPLSDLVALTAARILGDDDPTPTTDTPFLAALRASP